MWRTRAGAISRLTWLPPGAYDGPMEAELVTIATFRELPQALLAKGALTAAGISCVLADENVVRLNWFWANAVGGVRLQVGRDDVMAAVEVLHIPIPPEVADEELGPNYQQPRCPACDSLDVSVYTKNRWMSLVLLWFTGLPIYIPAESHWRCEECGAEWVDTEGERPN